MRVGLKYCGGCNPSIDRKNLTKRLRDKLKPYINEFEFFDYYDCETVIVLNGCSVACAEVPRDKKAIIVSGFEIDGKAYPEENLTREVIDRLEITPN